MPAAAQAHTDEKILVLADIAGKSIRPDASAANVDVGQYLIDVLGGVEAVDIAVPTALAPPRLGDGQLAGHQVTGGLTRADVAARLPALGDSLEVALARLTATGLIEDSTPGRYGGVGVGESLGATGAGAWILSAIDRLATG